MIHNKYQLHILNALLSRPKLPKNYLHFSQFTETYKERDHLKRTKKSPREAAMFSARVKQMEMLSSNIKKVVFELEERPTSFKAGQWVDMFIPSLTTVGGFSVCSSPSELRDSHLELAVKFSDHPPAYWTHTTCKIGDVAKFRFGGDFYWDPSPSECDHNLLLIAGGVGINPLYSILKHRRDLKGKFEDFCTRVICSSANVKDCIYRTEIEKLCEEIPNSYCKFHLTQTQDERFVNHRINRNDLEFYLRNTDMNSTRSYICGPPTFIDFIANKLTELGVDKSRIYFEKWW